MALLFSRCQRWIQWRQGNQCWRIRPAGQKQQHSGLSQQLLLQCTAHSPQTPSHPPGKCQKCHSHLGLFTTRHFASHFTVKRVPFSKWHIYLMDTIYTCTVTFDPLVLEPQTSNEDLSILMKSSFASTSSFFWSSPWTLATPTAVPLTKWMYIHISSATQYSTHQAIAAYNFANPALRTAVEMALMAVSNEFSRRVRLPVAPFTLRCSLRTKRVSVIVSTSTSDGSMAGADCDMTAACFSELSVRVQYAERRVSEKPFWLLECYASRRNQGCSS